MNNKIHLGIIPDGNRRWCMNKNKSIDYLINYWFKEIFQNEFKILKENIFNNNIDEKYNKILKIKELSIYLITADNINKRKDKSAQVIFNLIQKLYILIKDDLNDITSIFKYIKINIIYSTDLIPENILNMINDLNEITINNNKFLLTIGIGYDPYKDVQDLILNGKRDQTDIDLVFRSGGEKRLSGFFPYHTMHSELIFVDKFWPDIRLVDINKAVLEFENRNRRFGK